MAQGTTARRVGIVFGLWVTSTGPAAFADASFDATSSARLLVVPAETEVFVDGRFVGTADDFDGFTQRLRVPAGDHEIELYLEGHRSLRERVHFVTGQTYKVRHTMEPLPPGEAVPPRPGPVEPDREAPPESRRFPYGTLSVKVRPAAATVWIDGERWEAPEGRDLVVQLSEGRHQVEIRKEGRAPYAATVRILEGETTTLNVSLADSAPSGR